MTSRKLTYWTDENDSPQVAWVTIQGEEMDSGSPDLPSSAEHLDTAMELLTDKQQFVMRLRWGLVDGEVYSQEQIADLMGITLRAAQMIEERSMTWLHTALRGSGNAP